MCDDALNWRWRMAPQTANQPGTDLTRRSRFRSSLRSTAWCGAPAGTCTIDPSAPSTRTESAAGLSQFATVNLWRLFSAAFPSCRDPMSSQPHTRKFTRMQQDGWLAIVLIQYTVYFAVWVWLRQIAPKNGRSSRKIRMQIYHFLHSTAVCS